MSGKVLSTRYIDTHVTVRNQRAIANPYVQDIALGEVRLLEIYLRIPSGHAGFTGIRFEYAGVPFVPWNDPNAWISGEDERLTFDIDFDVASPLVTKSYNLDLYDHTFVVRCKVTDIVADNTFVSTPVVPIV